MPDLAPMLFLLPYLIGLAVLAAVPATFEPPESGRDGPIFSVLRVV